MKNTHGRTFKMARNTQKRGKWEMHRVGPGVWQENWKTLKMRCTNYRTWNMVRNTQKHEKLEIHTVGPALWTEN